jgi:hypothetical protein
VNEVKPAPLFQVRFDAGRGGSAPVETQAATVIVPFSGPEAPEFSVALRREEDFARELRVEWADRRTDRAVHTPRLAHPVRRFDDVFTDAPLVVISEASGAEAEVSVVGGSFAEIESG